MEWLLLALVALLMTGGSGVAGTAGSNSAKRELFIQQAMKELNWPYVTGGESRAEGGFDCSGLTYRAYNDSGLALPFAYRRVTEQAEHAPFKLNLKGQSIEYMKANIPRGFCIGTGFKWVDGVLRYEHVGIYLGNGQILQASASKGKVVISPFTSYWHDEFRMAYSWV